MLNTSGKCYSDFTHASAFSRAEQRALSALGKPEALIAFLDGSPEGTVVETEVLAPDTAPVETEAPVEELDTAEVEADGEDTGEQPEDTRDFDQELEEARKQAAEEARQSFEAETLLQNRQREIQRARQYLGTDIAERFKGTLTHFLEEVESGRLTAAQAEKQISPANLVKGYVGDLSSAVQIAELAQSDEFDNQVISSMYKDWRIPTDLLRKKELARQNLRPDLVRATNLEIMRRAVLENEAPQEAKKLAAEQAQKSKTAAQVRDTKAGDRERANAEQLTTISGGNGKASVSSMNDADREYNAGRINHDDYKAYRKKFGVD